MKAFIISSALLVLVSGNTFDDSMLAINLLDDNIIPTQHQVLSTLQDHGVLVFNGLGENYVNALQTLRKEAPSCLQGALSVEMEDGSQRFTTGRDTLATSQPFPSCLSKEVKIVTDVFDRVDKIFHKLLRQQFGRRLDLSVGEAAEERSWESLDMKTHVHVYKKTDRTTSMTETLPYHTDSGMYVLLTPSDLLHVNVISKNGDTHVLNTGDDSVILILGTGLTSWLLPGEGLYAAPHALPSISSISKPRSVIARMRVAPDNAVPSALPASPAFRTHFIAPLLTASGATLNRLKRESEGMGSDDCSLEWLMECGCTVDNTIMAWHNGEPIDEIHASDFTECDFACRDTPDCDGWTFNKGNGWCALKRADQIKLDEAAGFISGLRKGFNWYDWHCPSLKESNIWPESQCEV